MLNSNDSVRFSQLTAVIVRVHGLIYGFTITVDGGIARNTYRSWHWWSFCWSIHSIIVIRVAHYRPSLSFTFNPNYFASSCLVSHHCRSINYKAFDPLKQAIDWSHPINLDGPCFQVQLFSQTYIFVCLHTVVKKLCSSIQINDFYIHHSVYRILQ